jgi:hypothetical protein
LFLLIYEKVKDIYILYKGVHYYRMAYKVAQGQLIRLLEKVEEEEDDCESSGDGSSSGWPLHVSESKTL